MAQNFDILIIGGGVVGSAIARELSKYNLSIALIEKYPDVGFDTSCRNSGVVHSGIHYKHGTKRARLAVAGNAMMDKLCSDLKVKIKRIGKLTIAQNDEDMKGIDRLMKDGIANGVPGIRVINHEEMQKHQAGVSGIAAIWSPSTGIISPYGLTIALAENACDNGVKFFLNTEVVSIDKPKNDGENFVIYTTADTFNAKFVINAAGLFADKISEMIGVTESNLGEPLKIYPCRGEYYVLDKRLEGTVQTLLYPVPGAKDAGLGIHLTPTVDGNILIGPSAKYMCDESPVDYRVTEEILQSLRTEGQKLLPELKMSDFIRNFAGNRAKRTPPSVGGNGDFIIEETRDVPNFINLVGLESPALTSSPAIALDVKEILATKIDLREKENWNGERKGITGHFCDLPLDEQERLVKIYPDYGEIICRCEKITKKEIKDAIENKLGARTLESIKYRARNGMGRCQGGFCMPKIVRILRDEYGWTEDDFKLREKASYMFSGKARNNNEK